MIFDNTIKSVKEARQRALSGKLNCIPSSVFVRNKYDFIGYEKALYTLIAAGTSVGKSRFVKYVYVYDLIKNAEEYNIPSKTFFFALEESEQVVVSSLIAMWLFEVKGIRIDYRDFHTKRTEKILPKEIESILDSNEFADWHLIMDKRLKIISSIRNPTGIYKEVRNFAGKNGQFSYKGVPIEVPKSNNWSNVHWDEYKPNNPEEYVFVIVDNLNNLTTEKGKDKRGSMEMYSSEYCMPMRNKLGYSIVNVQQFKKDQERKEFTFSGKAIADKHIPTLESFAEAKNIANDAEQILALFDPYRHGIQSFGDYDITKLKNYFRSIHILKDRHGSCDNPMPLFFDGMVNGFKEMPLPSDKESMAKVYNRINYLKNEREL